MVYLILFGLLVLALAWFFLGGRGAAPPSATRRRPSDDIDYDELEQAEREVQEAPDETSVRDWGPGARRPPPAV
jgi:hypothetical protein